MAVSLFIIGSCSLWVLKPSSDRSSALQIPFFALILFPYDCFPVLALQSANGKVPVRNILKVVHEDQVDCAPSNRAHHRHQFGDNFLGNGDSESLSDYGDETGQGGGQTAFGGSGKSFGKSRPHCEVTDFGVVIFGGPRSKRKDTYAR
jgi:hypothetical protein